MRYTRYRGLDQVFKGERLKFAAMNLRKAGETEIGDADEDLDQKVKRRSVYSYENGIKAVQLYILSAAVTAYLMEYAGDWSISRAYLNPQSIQTLLQKAA